MRLFFSLILIFVLSQIACTKGYHDKIDDNGQYGKGSANLLSPQARLRKLSMHVRGIPPTLTEYENLQASMESGQTNVFFTQKINEYIQSPQYLGKMIERLDDLFGVRLQNLPAEKFYYEMPEKMKGLTFDLNSMDYIFRKVVKENLDWNTLFTDKTYHIPYPTPPFFFSNNYFVGRPSDLGFYNAIRPGDIPASNDGVLRKPDDEMPQKDEKERTLIPLTFEQNDSRIAGTITTSRFFARYNTTLLNKNRKRAAALFRILLCDDMKPIIPANEDISDLINKSFPKTNTGPSTKTPTDEIKHGTQQSCMACHQKLDPMGETFRTAGNVLSPEGAPGGLVYPTSDGRRVDIPVTGLGHLTSVTTEQHEYSQCQVRRFWDWFIGKDEPLTYERLENLVQEFERVKRKPNDFVAYLVQQKEFQVDQSGTFSRDATFAQVRPLFKQCSSCHAGVTSKSIPSFEKLPFGGSKDSHAHWINEIIEALDLEGDGSKAKMPTRDSGWILSADERKDFKNWISQGAQDENGNKTIEPRVFKNQEIKQAAVKTGTFGHSSLRYLSSMDMLRMLEQKFPSGWLELLRIKTLKPEEVPKNAPTCLQIMDQKALGFFNPALIEPTTKGPSLAYVKWYSKCILELSKIEFEKIKSKNETFDRYLGKSVISKTKGTPLEELRKNADTFPWKDIPKDIQEGIALHLIQDSIGRQVAGREYEIVQKALAATEDLKSPVATEAIKSVLLVAMLQDEFLTF